MDGCRDTHFILVSKHGSFNECYLVSFLMPPTVARGYDRDRQRHFLELVASLHVMLCLRL